jgi:lipopolysaccharide export system permease protein
MSILSRYTVKEILSHLAGVMFIVVAVFMVRRFAEFLGDAAEGDLPSGVLLRLLGLRTVMALPSLLPAGLYIATLPLGRLSDDNEMTALGACGVSESDLPRGDQLRRAGGCRRGRPVVRRASRGRR